MRRFALAVALAVAVAAAGVGLGPPATAATPPGVPAAVDPSLAHPLGPVAAPRAVTTSSPAAGDGLDAAATSGPVAPQAVAAAGTTKPSPPPEPKKHKKAKKAKKAKKKATKHKAKKHKTKAKAKAKAKKSKQKAKAKAKKQKAQKQKVKKQKAKKQKAKKQKAEEKAAPKAKTKGGGSAAAPAPITPHAPGNGADPVPFVPPPVPTPHGSTGAGQNLIVNPSAEAGACTTSGYDGTTVPGWTVVNGAPDVVCYGAIGFPKVGSPGPADAGGALFSGGATGSSMLSQTISLASVADRIDTGTVSYDLSGWLGGWAAQDDRVGLTATFLNPAGDPIGLAEIAPVTGSDRNSVTQLLRRAAIGTIPPGTRTVTIALLFTWAAGDTTDGYADDVSFATSLPLQAPKLAVPQSEVPQFDHVFVVFMENENGAANEAPVGKGDYIPDNPDAPYLNRVIAAGSARLDRMYATTHPSDPNYLAVTGGSTFGRTTNPVVGRDMIDAPNLGDRLDQAGETWAGYAEGMRGSCDMTSHNTKAGGYYLPDDEPFMLYADIAGNPARCAQHNLPLTQLAADLGAASTTPAFVWFAANDVNDMEGGGVRTGDTWLSRTIPQILASPAWTTQRSLLIISWDEGHTKAFGPGYPNHVATYLMASQGLVKDGYVSQVRYTDYSLAATIEEALGLAPLTSNDEYADRINDIWTTPSDGGGLPPGAES